MNNTKLNIKALAGCFVAAALALFLALPLFSKKAEAQPVEGGNLLSYASIASASTEWPARTTNATTITGTNNLRVSGPDLTVEPTGELTTTGTTNVSIGILQSVTGRKYQLLKTVGIAANGTTAVTLVTNVGIGAAKYVRLTIMNTDATALLTNYSVTLGATYPR